MSNQNETSNTWKARCVYCNNGSFAGSVIEVKDGVVVKCVRSFPSGLNINFSELVGYSTKATSSFKSWEEHNTDSIWELITDEPEQIESDNINPKHYKSQCSLECIETMLMAFGVEDVYKYCVITAWKYMWRYQNKNGVEDIKKARWFVDKAKELIPEYSEWQNIEFILKKIEDNENEK